MLLPLLRYAFSWPSAAAAPAAAAAPCDVLASPEAYTIQIDVPGVDAAQLRLELYADRYLAITCAGVGAGGGGVPPSTAAAAAAAAAAATDVTWLRRERAPREASWQRCFEVPRDVDAGAIGASLSRGVLTVTFPRRRQRQQKAAAAGGGGGGGGDDDDDDDDGGDAKTIPVAVGDGGSRGRGGDGGRATTAATLPACRL